MFSYTTLIGTDIGLIALGCILLVMIALLGYVFYLDQVEEDATDEAMLKLIEEIFVTGFQPEDKEADVKRKPLHQLGDIGF
jgi:hypothetical protein